MENLQETTKNKFILQFQNDETSNQHIIDIIKDRFEKLKFLYNGKFFYSLKIEKTPSRINYHNFSLDNFQEISRKLTNGMTSLGLVPNRIFWNNNFIGGIRTTSIILGESDEFPRFNLNYILISEFDNLDVKIYKQLLTRIKMIDPTLSFSIDYIGNVTNFNQISDIINFETNVDFSNENLSKFSLNTIQDIYNNQYQRPRFLGKFFKS